MKGLCLRFRQPRDRNRAVAGDCAANSGEVTPPLHSDDADFHEKIQTYGIVTAIDSSGSLLRLRNMRALKNYKIKYYSPYDQINPIKEETILTELISPSLGLRFPDLDTLDIILFEAFLVGENFKSLNSDTTENKVSSRIEQEQETDEVLIYPNPNNGSFIISVGDSNGINAIHISNNLGQTIDSRSQISRENKYVLNYFNSGVYSVEVVYSDKIIRKKMVIN